MFVTIETASISGMNVNKVESKWPAVDADDWCGLYYNGNDEGVRKNYARLVNEKEAVPLTPIMLGRKTNGELE